jgi:hypothetical protein
MIMAKQKDNLTVGRPDVKVTAPAHVRGVPQGNRLDGGTEHEEARRSTGIDPRARRARSGKGPQFPPP